MKCVCTGCRVHREPVVPEFRPGAAPQSGRAHSLTVSFRTAVVWVKFPLRTALGNLLFSLSRHVFLESGLQLLPDVPFWLQLCQLGCHYPSELFRAGDNPTEIWQQGQSAGSWIYQFIVNNLQLLGWSVLMDSTQSRPGSTCTNAPTSRVRQQPLDRHYSVEKECLSAAPAEETGNLRLDSIPCTVQFSSLCLISSLQWCSSTPVCQLCMCGSVDLDTLCQAESVNREGMWCALGTGVMDTKEHLRQDSPGKDCVSEALSTYRQQGVGCTRGICDNK